MITFSRYNNISDSNSVVVTDCRVADIYNIRGDNVFIAPEGEKAKTFAVVQKLCSFLIERDIDRYGTLYAVGGGSIGDLCGFVASIYKRGIKYVNYPTTLLAMIDSSIGGKTAINLEGIKNVIGTFYHYDTIIDVTFIDSINETQLKCGWGEIIKYTFLDEEIDKLVIAQAKLTDIIRACVNYKHNLTKDNYCENLIRRQLNIGHTIGHALELKYNLPHGIAVLNGLYYELELARHSLDSSYIETKQNQIKQITNIVNLNRSIIPKLKQDKKNADGKICFILPNGDYTTHEVMLTAEQFATIMKL